jgi:benzoyl-CoA reductase subunit D
LITAGIDMGSKAIKVVVQTMGQVIGSATHLAGSDAAAAAQAALDQALLQAKTPSAALDRLFSTGVGREEAPAIDRTVTEISCIARGATHLCPGTKMVVDVGAEDGRVVRCNEQGKVVDFAINEKCAAGAGAFAEALARALEVSLEELGPLSLTSKQSIPITAHCVVFAESEVVSLIHHNVPKQDVARAVHDAMAARLISMIRRVGLAPSLVVVGGLAMNVGFVDALRRGLSGVEVLVPPLPELCNALGAALAAAEGRTPR